MGHPPHLKHHTCLFDVNKAAETLPNDIADLYHHNTRRMLRTPFGVAKRQSKRNSSGKQWPSIVEQSPNQTH